MGNLIALFTADASMAVVALNVTMVEPSAAIVIAPVPESVTVTLESPCDTELVDIVVKLNVPAPLVCSTCPDVPSAVGKLNPLTTTVPVPLAERSKLAFDCEVEI